MMQEKLGSLIGRPSGYIESLPENVRRRVSGLKGIQKDHAKLESEFQEEVLQLEKKYFAKFTPLYEKRSAIVNGEVEPTEAEIEAGKVDEDEEDAAADDEDPEDKAAQEDVKGIPEFWLTAIKNQISLAELITDRDEEALRSLTDIRMEYLDRPGFRLIFEFASNDFFTNKTISKTYFYREESGYGGDFIYDHAEGEKIDWKAGKDLTVRIESKKQRNKSKKDFVPHPERVRLTDILLDTKQTRVIKKTVPTESFFNFFSPPLAPTDDDEVASDIEERLELDYQLGEDIKEKLIPRAIDWFTGDALAFEEFEDGEDAEFDDEDDEDEEEDEEAESDEDDEEEGGKPRSQQQSECKNQ